MMMVCNLKKMFSMSRMLNFVVKQKSKMLLVKLLSELQLLSCTIYVNNANMALTLAQLLLFQQNEGKWIKRGKYYYRWEYGELPLRKQRVGSVRDRCWDVTKAIIRCVIVPKVHFQSLIRQQLCDKQQLFCLAKLSFKLTNMISEIGGTI